MSLRVLGVITARGGSKGVPRKNIRDLGGKPLIAWTIEAAKASQRLTRTVVSTDDEEIIRVAKEWGGDVPFLRPAELATDTAKSIPVIQHALTWLKENEGQDYDAVLILQPTSPFRTTEDIENAIRLLEETGADSVMGMKEVIDGSLAKLKILDEQGRILPALEDEGKSSAQRTEGKKLYRRNCAIYLTRVPFIMQGDLFGQDSRAYLMPEERSLDINTPLDYAFAQFLASRPTNS